MNQFHKNQWAATATRCQVAPTHQVQLSVTAATQQPCCRGSQQPGAGAKPPALPTLPPAPSCSALCPAPPRWAAPEAAGEGSGQQQHSHPRPVYLSDGAKSGSRLVVKFPTEAVQTSVSTHRGGRPSKGTAEESPRCSLEPGIPRAQHCNDGGLGVTAGVLPLLKGSCLMHRHGEGGRGTAPFGMWGPTATQL